MTKKKKISSFQRTKLTTVEQLEKLLTTTQPAPAPVPSPDIPAVVRHRYIETTTSEAQRRAQIAKEVYSTYDPTVGIGTAIALFVIITCIVGGMVGKTLLEKRAQRKKGSSTQNLEPDEFGHLVSQMLIRIYNIGDAPKKKVATPTSTRRNSTISQMVEATAVTTQEATARWVHDQNYSKYLNPVKLTSAEGIKLDIPDDTGSAGENETGYFVRDKLNATYEPRATPLGSIKGSSDGGEAGGDAGGGGGPVGGSERDPLETGENIHNV